MWFKKIFLKMGKNDEVRRAEVGGKGRIVQGKVHAWMKRKEKGSDGGESRREGWNRDHLEERNDNGGL